MPARGNLPGQHVRSIACGVLAAVLTLVLGACDLAQHRKHGLIFSDWYIAKPVVETGITTAYGRLTNTQSETVALNRVELDCADKVEMHETIESAGQLSMRELASVTLPGGATLVFQPGSKHLMISGFKSPANGKCQATFTVAGHPINLAIPVKERSD